MDAQDYFSLNVNPKSFMNPVNIKSFLDNYEDKNYPPITKRFNLENQTEIDAVVAYFYFILQDQVNFQSYGGRYDQTAFAKLIIKTLSDSYNKIRDNVPFELLSRYSAAGIQVAGHDCKYYLNQASTDSKKVDTICAANAFNILAQLKPFLAPAYFTGNATYMQVLKNMTLLTDAELTSLYNLSNSESLASVVSQ